MSVHVRTRPPALPADTPPRLFAPSAAALNWVISIGFVALGYALYMRYLVIQQSSVGLACDLGLDTWLCLSRKVSAALFDRYVFGWVSLGRRRAQSDPSVGAAVHHCAGVHRLRHRSL